MENRLYRAGIIAIPLLSNIYNANFLVIDRLLGKTLTRLPNSNNISDAVMISYRIVNREILQSTMGKQEELIERELIPSEVLPIPIDILPKIFSFERIKNNIEDVNYLLSLFSFRGILEGLILQVDLENVNLILSSEAIENQISFNDPQ